MSSSRLVLALGTLMILACGYYYFDVYKAAIVEEEKRISLKALNFGKSAIVTISIGKPGKETIRLVKTKSDWIITEPVSDKADSQTVAAALAAAENLAIKGNAGKVGAVDLNEFGLDDPAVATFELEDSSHVTLKIGNPNPAGLEYYAIAKSPNEVILIKKPDADNILKSLYDFRSKSFFPFGAGAVTKIEIEKGTLQIVIGKKEKDEGWSLVKPVNADADATEINEIIRAAAMTKIAGFVDEKGDDLAKYGLEKPAARVTLTSDKAREAIMLIGRETARGGRYAKLSGRPNVVRIAGDLFSVLPSSADKLRDRSLIKVKYEDVTKIVVETAVEKVTLESFSNREKDGADLPPVKYWRITEPEKVKADSSAVSNLIYDLNAARAIRFVEPANAKYGLDNPDLQITVMAGSGKSVFLRINKTRIGYYAMVEGAAAIVEIDQNTYASLAKGFDFFMVRRLLDIRSDEIYAVELKRHGQLFKARKNDDGFVLEKPERRKLAAAAWNRLVWTILSLEYTEKIELEGTGYTGFEKPEITILIYNAKGVVIGDLTIAPGVDNKPEFYVKKKGDDVACSINAGFVTADIVKALEGLMKKQVSGFKHD